MRAIELVEAPGLPLLLSEQLYDAHAGQPFLKERVDPGDAHADVAIGFADALPKETGYHHHERNHRERRQTQAPIYDQHGNADRNQREQIAEPGDDSGG